MTVSAEIEIQTPVVSLSKSVLKKKDPTPAEALAILEHYENELKEAARTRTLSVGENGYENSLYQRTAVKSFIASTILLFGGGGYSAALGPANEAGGLPMIVGIALAIATSGVAAMNNPKVNTFVSPIKSRKLRTQAIINEQLHDMLQEDFSVAEERILKKVNHAVRVINKSLALKGRELRYCSEIGNEGFSVVEKEEMKSLSKWQSVGTLFMDDYVEVKAINAKPAKVKN